MSSNVCDCECYHQTIGIKYSISFDWSKGAPATPQFLANVSLEITASAVPLRGGLAHRDDRRLTGADISTAFESLRDGLPG
jgi:hypothetical protein